MGICSTCASLKERRDRETIHIPNNFTRKERYYLYKDYVQGDQGNGNFIKYVYFKRVWKISSTTFSFQRGQGWGSAVHVLILNKEGIDNKG